MSDCPFTEDCPFLAAERARGPDAAVRLLARVCHARPACCARYLVQGSLGPEAVPDDLTPAETERAQALIAPAQTG